MQPVIQNDVFINRPLEEVFTFVTDPTTTPLWQKNLVRSELLTPGPLRSGTRVLEVRRLGTAQRQAEWEVTAYEPSTRRGYVYLHSFGPIQQRGETCFEAQDGGTLLHFTAWLKVKFPLTLIAPLLVSLMRQQNDKSFFLLKQLLEADASTHASSSVQQQSR